MEPDRFDDVGFEILESPDEPRAPRRTSRRTVALVAASVCSAAAVAAGAALALSPPRAAAPPAASHRQPVPASFVAERYPARGSLAARATAAKLDCHARMLAPSRHDATPRY